MGSFNSKISPSNDKIRDGEQGEEPTIDPRSPTLHINRSPISPEKGGVSRTSITKVKDLTAALTETETSMVTNLQTPNIQHLPKRFQSIIDPRSPSTFTRTPLLVDTESVTLDCSNLANIVSTLQYDDVREEDRGEASFKDCDTEGLPVDICSLQIEQDDDESAPILEPTDPNEVTVFEDAEVVPFAGIDPRSPSIAIARTPMVLGKDEEAEKKREAMMEQVEKVEDTKGNVEGQEHTPKQNDLQQQQQDGEAGRGEATPKKDKQSPASGGLKAGSRTPLGCVTNIGTAGNNIRRLALMGQLKQKSIATDEQKLIARSPNAGGAEPAAKQVNRSRIPKLRLS
ncbi:uncharacterized protein LOC118467073 [Anopheles albimanus]|uniref:uncharacterized protein LOC118467073 n=1 Tax=Anopheles albimanus TaxID=7167 RepID=UPI00163FD74D|nr:uncharacterized protein LOC118467073 [Anopheles albimanus]